MKTAHRFFHFDGRKSLSPGQVVTPGLDGRSSFGQHYVDLQQRVGCGTWPLALYREVWLENLRQAEYQHRESRYTGFFAAQTLADAKRHLERIRSGTGTYPSGDVPIYEVFAQSFHLGDVMWLDIAGPGLDHPTMLDRYRRYWSGETATANDTSLGLVRVPLMEAVIPLPVRIGERVA